MEKQANVGAVKQSAGRASASKSSPASGPGQPVAAQSAATGSSTTQSGGQGLHDHDHDGDCIRICAREVPEKNETLEKRHNKLEEALHGSFGTNRRRKYNWSGRNEVTLTFASIEKLLDDAFPPDRPTDDFPERSVKTKQAGS